MKWILFFGLLPTLALAAKIPVDGFDQSKLETLLRNIPSSLVRTEQFENYKRKYHVFPLNEGGPFRIECTGDYYGQSEIPSFKQCSVEVESTEFAGDEYQLKIKDLSVIDELLKAISYGSEVKKFYSTERVYGRSFSGVYRELFRYSIVCRPEICHLSFSTKVAH